MKIDLHCHSYYSKDGFSSPEKLIKTALKKGLDGIALTDHNTTAGWKEAIEAAKKLKAVLVLGEEIKTNEGDLLGLFLKKEVKEKNLSKAIKEIKDQGGIAIIPHPFQIWKGFRENLEKYKEIIDGVEVFNTRFSFLLFDKRALDFAKKYNLAMTAGSDAHYFREAGGAYTMAKEAKNLEEFKKAILEKKTKIEGKKSSLFYLVFVMMAKVGIKENFFKKFHFTIAE